MDRNRPQGRERRTFGNSKEVHRKGQGLNTGPVGNGKSARPGADNRPHFGRSSSRGSERSGTRGGLGKLAIIAVAAVLLLGGGGVSGLFGNLLGGGTDTAVSYSDNTDYSQTYSGSGYSGYSDLTDFSSLFGTDTSSESGTWTTDTSATAVDESVSASARTKYTEILGNGQDEVTIMVYMCGTDLESKSGMATNDLTEMAKATLSDNLHVLVYTGGCKQWKTDFISSQNNQIYEVVSGGLKPLETDMGTGAMTSPDTLTSFIQYSVKKYPANRYELIFWDHGGGSVSGYGYDEKNARAGSMTLAGINEALKKANVKFDFIGFDTCLMGTVENGLMLDAYADYMIASEETEPGIGWYYKDWLTEFAADTSMPTLQVGKNIIDSFVETCNAQCYGQKATLSLVDLSELSQTVPTTLRDFSQSLSEMIADNQYQQISEARNNAHEFARSNQLDQVDLVDFATKIGNTEGTKLSKALTDAVKYNRTSSNITNAYGVSVYFPYRKASLVDHAVSTYNAIDMDSSYTACIREFASLEVCGQAASGGTSSPISSLFGNFSGSSSGSSDLIGSLLSSFLGGDVSSISGLSGNSSFLSGRSMSDEEISQYILDHSFDASSLTWKQNSQGQAILRLTEEQWGLVQELELNMFYDDGEGYVDLGLDTVYDFDEDQNLLAYTDRTWLSVNGQPVAFYHESTEQDGDQYIISGYIPAMLNGERVKLLVLFDEEHPYGTITGAQRVYMENETETVPKNEIEIAQGDRIQFLCDYYTYDGTYENTYQLGEDLIVSEELVLSNESVGDGPVLTMYRFTDIYQQHYWSETYEN